MLKNINTILNAFTRMNKDKANFVKVKHQLFLQMFDYLTETQTELAPKMLNLG